MAKKTKQEKIDAKKEREYYKKHKRQFKLKPSDVIFSILNYAFFIIFTLSCIFPFYYLFINTISDNDLVKKGAINFWPEGIHLGNYTSMIALDVNVLKSSIEGITEPASSNFIANIIYTVKAYWGCFTSWLTSNDIIAAFGVSITRTVIGTVLMVVASAFVGYLVTKQEMWHRKFWYRFLVITMYFNAGLIPAYLNMSMLGLTNNFMAYIIPGIVAPYNIILVKTYIESIPAELEESAFMDGASYMTIFRKIIWPLSKPILATIFIFGAVGHWNSFTDSLIYMQGAPEYYTLQHRLYTYLNQASNITAIANSTTGLSETMISSMMNTKVIKYTVSMVTIIPILVVYPFMNKYFEKGIMLGAVKG